MEVYDHPYQPAHIFTLRLWQEELSRGEMEWRLQLRSVETDKTHYFRDWPSLIGLLLEMVPSVDDGRRTMDDRREFAGSSTDGEHGGEG